MGSATIGALVGAVIGLLDYFVLARIIRGAIASQAKRGTVTRGGPGTVDWLLRIVLVVNVLVFAALGAWLWPLAPWNS